MSDVPDVVVQGGFDWELILKKAKSGRRNPPSHTRETEKYNKMSTAKIPEGQV